MGSKQPGPVVLNARHWRLPTLHGAQVPAPGRPAPGLPPLGAGLLTGGHGGERAPAGRLTLREKKPENSTAPRRVLPGCDRASGREDVPVAPPSVRGADNALARAARSACDQPWDFRLGLGPWDGSSRGPRLWTSDAFPPDKKPPRRFSLPAATKAKKKICQNEWNN